MAPAHSGSVFVVLVLGSIISGNFANRETRQTESSRSRIVSQNGHMIFESASHRNITFRSSNGGFINIGDVDLGQVITQVRDGKTKIEELWNANIKERLTAVEGHTETISSMERTLEELGRKIDTLEAASGSATSPTVPPQSSSDVTRRLSTLESDVSSLQRLQRLRGRNECDNNPCRNGATCIDLFDAYLCQCTNGWKGRQCDEDINECVTLAGTAEGCQNGATCINAMGTFRCECTANWHGIICTVAHDDCSESSNQLLCGHGVCEDVTRAQPGQPRYRCECNDGWDTDGVRPECTLDINECEADQPACSHDPPVTCINVPGSFYCGQCPAGYTGNGFYCNDIDECLVNNGGCYANVQCINIEGSRRCGPCPRGYAGDGVSCVFVGMCTVENGGCSHHATCQENAATGFNGVTCTCSSGFTGSGVGPHGCQPANTGSNTGACANHPCQHGSCQISGSSFTCTCDDGWIGTNCNEVAHPCTSNPCQNGGTCSPRGSRGDAYTCVCTDRYTGTHCQEQQQSCGGRLDGESGTLRYPHTTGQSYDHNVNCAWVITTSPNKVMSLSVVRFNLEAHDNCDYDFLQINDGPDASSNVIGKYCGDAFPNGGTINSTHNQLYLWFRSDASVASDGFVISWSSGLPVCQEVFTGNHGVITSPGFPGKYPHNRDCTWTVHVPLGNNIRFTFGNIYLQQSENCSADFLTITDAYDAAPIGQYCTEMTPSPLTTTGPIALLTFHTDATENANGFSIHYSAIQSDPGCGGAFTSDNGVLISPNYPNPYSHRSQCIWTITVSEGDTISVNFTNMNLEHHDECQWDYLEIRDGTEESSNFLGRYCGNTVPQAIISTTNALLIKFKSDESNTGTGFRLTWNVHCGGTFTENSGVLTSPGFPNAYGHNKDCYYIITQPPASIITLNFTAFNLEAGGSSGSCDHDYLEVRDGQDENSVLLGRFCTSTTPSVQVSSGRRLWVHFHSDGSVSAPGFSLIYNSTHNTLSTGGETGGSTGPSLSGCGGRLTSGNGTFSSPRRPRLYPSRANCTWILDVTEGFIIRLIFNSFILESHNRCNYDYVQIYDGINTDAPSLGRFCGQSLPPSLTSASNFMTVIFRTDGSVQREGFEASYVSLNASTVCGQDLRTSPGVITSPGYPSNYWPSRECVWTIVQPTNHQILLNVTDFLLQDHPACESDYLEIRNGGSAESPLIGKYCGDHIPEIFRSHSNRLHLKLVTDGNQNQRGFRINYESFESGCGGEFVGEAMGSFVSPNFPSNYPQRSSCVWTISVSHGSSVQLNFPTFSMERHSTCLYDYVEVREQDATGILVGKYCGSTNPPTIHSATNKLWVKFKTDSSGQGGGFRADFTTSCNNRLTAEHGVIESPNFPSPYPYAANCTWIIESMPNSVINTSFSHFALEGGSSGCQYDYLALRAGADASAPLIGQYCGHDLPPIVSSPGSQLWVHFVSDASMSHNGFRMEYVSSSCGGTLRGDSGQVMTPDWPAPISQNLTCKWTLITRPGSRIQFNITDLDLAAGEQCSNNALDIYGGEDTSSFNLLHLCKSSSTELVTTSSGNYIVVLFNSSVVGRKGFKASYTAVPDGCGGVFSAPSGVITSKNYPSRYPRNTDCLWRIVLPSFSRIRMTFVDMEIERATRCRYDYVMMYDGPDQDHQILMNKTCGRPTLPFEYLSTTNQVLLRMRSDGSSEHRGFKMNFATACGASITNAEDGEITSPSFPGLYPSNTSCQWQIETTPGEQLTLTFTHLDVGNTGDCSSDSIRVEGGGEPQTICGQAVPLPITSIGSTITVTLLASSLSNTQHHGFRAVYSKSTSSCGGRFTAESGAFNSPGFPNGYSNNEECVWEMVTSPSNRLQLSFSIFNLENSEHCNNDYLEVRENGVGGRLLGRFCGTQTPLNIHGLNSLYIKFRTNEDVPGYGFMATYSSMNGAYLQADSGSIGSPQYPSFYPSNSTYEWVITVGQGLAIQLTFTIMDIQGPPCTRDYILVHDGEEVLPAMCGHDIPEVWTSSTNVVRLSFVSNAVGSGQGFLLSWQAVQIVGVTPATLLSPTTPFPGCGGSLTATDTMQNLSSPRYPMPYGDNWDCSWTISAPENQRIWLNITDLDLEGGDPDECRYDYLTISTQGRDDQAFCGSLINAEPIKSIDNRMLVQFKSDSSVHYSGFSLDYRAVCGGYISEAVGTVQSPSESEPADCDWVIRVSNGRTIAIEMNTFNIRESSGCSNDFLEFYNGPLDDSPLLSGPHCGSSSPSIPQTSGHLLRIHYSSDGSGPVPSFSLTFREVSFPCGGHLTLTDAVSSGILLSPEYPNNYHANLDCIWVVTAPATERIQVDFKEQFMIESHPRCRYDYIEMRDGGTIHAPLIDRFCGYDLPSSQVSSGHVLFIRFRTDDSVPRMGFKLRYQIATCGGRISGASGRISSPNYPSNYDANLDCEWTVQGPVGHYLKLSWTTVNMQYSENCTADYLEIRDYNSTGPLIRRLCGSGSRSVETSDSTAVVIFHSDATRNYRGFVIQFEASIDECGGPMTTPSGTLTSPNYPGNYPHRRVCIWHIEVEEDRRISLTITDLDLEHNEICYYDGLFIFNGISPRSPAIGQYCGSTPPENAVESSSNTMAIVFRSDGSVTGRGFSASYSSLLPSLCGGRISSANSTSGVISSPGFDSAETYNSSVQCVWQLENLLQGSVAIQFNHLDLEPHGECMYDFVEITEGPDNSPVTSACGNRSMPLLLTSPWPEVKIRLVTDLFVNHQGFSLTYLFTDCGGILTNPSGVITSPNYPQNYPQNQACVWKITAPDGYQIKVNFTHFDMESDCQLDYITITNGGLESSPRKGSYCGSNLLTTFTSESNEMRILFVTDSVGSARGFRMQYSFDSRGCGGDFHSTSAVIKSPNWPNDYPYNVECTWTLTIPAGFHVLMNFIPPFDFEIQNPCVNDYVQITDLGMTGPQANVGRFCGNVAPAELQSKTNKVKVTFRANEKNSFDGFALNYTGGCGATFSEPEGAIISPGYPNRYFDNLNCTYIIDAYPTQHVLLTFNPDVFHIEGGVPNKHTLSYKPTNESNAIPMAYQIIQPQTDEVHCSYDYVEVFGGVNTSEPLGRFCGHTAPQTLVSIGRIVLRFITDASVTDQGWRAEYRAQECGGQLTAPSATFHSPTHPLEYLDNSNCTWLITVQENHVIELKFNSFSLEAGSDCRYDYVALYDGNNFESRFLGRFCGIEIPDIIRSTSNQLLVNFISDSSVSSNGFSATYRTTIGPAQGCGGYVHATSGSITSPDVNNDGNYDADLTCVWVLRTEPNQRIQLHFVYFDLFPSQPTAQDSQPVGDYLQVVDGAFADDLLIATLSGSRHLDNITSTGNVIRLLLHSDSANSRRGFQLRFSSVPRTCGGAFIATDSPHFITSPGFPSLLGDNEICRWSIVAANDSQISIKFPSFDVASRSAQGDCSQGVLHLYERSVSRDSYYCGNVSIPEYKSLTSTVVVLLTTNSPSGGGTGFRLSYQIASCNQTYSESSGQILSPGWPGNYPHLSNCQMLIEAPSGYSVSLYFHIFSLESHEQCAFDHLQVFNGSSDTGPLLFTLCGPTLPSPIFTPSNALLLRFTSDDSLAQSGFHLTYTSSPLGCGGNLTGSSGTFTSHLYPSPPPANSTCSWLIIAHQGSHVVEFENFDVLKEPGHFGCSNNFVVVYDGRTESSPIIATYCGEDRPSQISPSGSYLLVKHVSGSGLIGSGFKATYHPHP